MGLSSALVSLVIASFLMSFSIGANDAANALATSYGTNAIKISYLLLLGAVFEFIGASVFSSKIAGTLANQFIIGLNTFDVKVQTTMMLGTCFSSVIFIMTSSFIGIPISGSHTIVGAIIGSGLAAGGKNNVNWKQLGTVILSWFISPLFAGILASVIFFTVCQLTLKQRKFGVSQNCTNSDTYRLRNLTLISAATSMLFAFLLWGLIEGDAPSGGVQTLGNLTYKKLM